MNSLIDIFIVYVTVMFTASLIRDKIVRTDTGPVPSDMRRLMWKVIFILGASERLAI